MEDGKKPWQPPPRPPELKDVHVVDLNAEKTGESDYLALISGKEKRPPAPHPKAALASSKQMSATQAPQITEYALSSVQSEPIKPPTSSFFKRTLMVLTTLSLIFVGTYFLVHSLSNNKGRGPANILPKEVQKSIRPESVMRPRSSMNMFPTHPSAVTSAPQDTLGLGNNRANIRNNRAMSPTPTSEPTTPQTNEPERQQDATQPENYSAEQATTPLQPSVYPPGQPDPNTGVVQPPGFTAAPMDEAPAQSSTF